MRKTPAALFSGIGRYVALMVIFCGLVVLGLGLWLQVTGAQNQYRDMHRQQLRQAAAQTALFARARLDSAAVLLRMQIDAASRGAATAPTVVAQLRRPVFGFVTLLASGNDSFEAGGHNFNLSTREREALEAGGTVLISATGSAAAGRLYLLLATGHPERPVWVLAELRGEWLWSELGAMSGALAVLDSHGTIHFSSEGIPDNFAASLVAALPGLPAGGSSIDLTHAVGDKSWLGAMARINSASTTSELEFAVLTLEPARPRLAAFWPVLRQQGLLLLVLVVLALGLAHGFASRLLQPLQQLRRALAQLPDRRLMVPTASRQFRFREVRQLVDAYNRSAEAIETQSSMRRVLDELDALLLPGGDYESVIDQVLTRVRAVTHANNVGLALVDPGIAGHGRLYVVNAEGGAPVNRVILDATMVATLRDADEGLTITRCEPGRHSFLEPLQAAGSSHFWVWPVRAADELAAILTVGYGEPPAFAERIADTGTLCAQRLGLALSNNARAERLYRQAHFDPLTQLPNRQLFREQLQHELEATRREAARGALLYIDLDHFKRVNDSLGHEAGDKLLAIVAQRMQGCVKEGDTVARLGGDEFTVILRGIRDRSEVGAVAERIVDAMRQPMWLGGRDHHVQASIGITLFPEDGTELDQLLHYADLAMYRAKDLGRGGAVFYSTAAEKRGLRVADSGLYRAIKHREFSLYYQPQYRIDDGRLAGIEALLRWNRPREGIVVPAEFIPAAEESGIIVEIGVWVVEAACAQIAQWRDVGVIAPRVALNLSILQLRDGHLAAELGRQLARHQLHVDAIELEMNEAALTDPQSAPGIEALSALGTRLTLDDFGTGSTALANLRRYPVSAVKIDRSFVQQLQASASAAALADTIIVMAHSQRKQVIAEGVETLEQLEYLRERGCDIAQGFFMARPLSSVDMTDLLLGNRDRRGRNSARA
ncbi:MAG: EAL domain-containing protein [Pseudomonadota bacterium]